MKMVRVVAVSDLHGLTPRIPECDLLVIAGDVCPVVGSHSPTRQQHWLETVFFPWLAAVVSEGTAQEVALTPGNHDFVFQRHPLIGTPEHAHLLIDREVELLGLRVYGSPWCPRFGGWAFMLDDSALEEKFSKIPEGLDILITHGPAYGVCDEILSPKWEPHGDTRLGSPELLGRVKEAKPRWHLSGHIHTAQHVPAEVLPGVRSACVSLLDEGYEVRYAPLTFDILAKGDQGDKETVSR